MTRLIYDMKKKFFQQILRYHYKLSTDFHPSIFKFLWFRYHAANFRIAIFLKMDIIWIVKYLIRNTGFAFMDHYNSNFRYDLSLDHRKQKLLQVRNILNGLRFWRSHFMIMQRFSTCLIFFYCVTPSIKWPISQPQSTVVAKYGFEQENVCHPL